MSAEAVGWVLKASPYTGHGFACHIVVADAVNAHYEYRFWMTVPTLARLARCDTETARRWLHRAVADDYLEEVEKGGGRGKPTVYRFLMPKPRQNAGLYESETPENRPTKPRRNEAENPENRRNAHITNPREPKEITQPSAEPSSTDALFATEQKRSQKATDPVVAEAHELATRVFRDRNPKPLPSFLNVRALAERALRAGWAAADIEEAMMRPDTVFTTPGLETARAKHHAAANGNGRPDDEPTSVRMARIRAERGIT